MKKIFAVSAMALACAVMATNAQTYPPTLKVPVTFYDYYSNGSNPEFEPNTNAYGLYKNLVAPSLDAQLKPVAGTATFFSTQVGRWYRLWYSTPTKPVYNNSGALTGTSTTGADTAFKNLIFQDTLIFNYLPGSPGTYEFNDQAFFRLDGKGFGAEGRAHNFSYAMELHWKFTKQSGLKFKFTGDDDVWAFINGHCAMDLGGIHGPQTDSLTVDTIPGLHNDSTYTFDFFYAERHTTESHILIQSNIISAPPASLQISVYPPTDTITAGTSVYMVAHITDDTGAARPDLSKLVTWRLQAIPPSATLRSWIDKYQDSTNTFHAIEAYKWYYIIGNYADAKTNLLDTVRVWVKPAAPNHLVIESDTNSLAESPNADNPLNSVTFTSTMLRDSVYAVLRDTFGNYYSHATSAAWSVASVICSVKVGSAVLGQGVITRVAASGNTEVYASQNNMKDTLEVILNNVNYSKINITATNNPRDSVTGLQMRTDQDTTLWAMGLRADGSGKWDSIQVTWSNSAGLSFDRSAPGNSHFWAFQPLTAGTGKIFISQGTLRDTISVVFNYGLPNTMGLYPQPGTPNVGSNTPYPQTVYATAGQPFPIVAKLFSANNEWLSSYERKSAPIAWTVQEMTGATNSGTFDTNFGYMVNFTGRKAYQVVKVTATFSENGNVITQSMFISIQPGAPAKLVIEPDTTGRSAYPNTAHPAGTVTIGGASTAASVYAVLRDANNNFISFSILTTWLSRDSSQVTAANGNMTIGEGVCTRVANTGQAYVVAQDGTYGFRDSVLIKLSNISYTALRIVVRDSTKISNLAMTIDQDTLLKVQGRRSDGTGWDTIPAAWSITNTLTTVPGAPGSSASWRFSPTDTGTGWIKVTLTGATPDSVRVQFSHGVPRYIALYPAEGNPISLQPYPAPIWPVLDSSGSILPIVAKVFDKAGIWLSGYENSSSPVSWTMVEFPANQLTPTGTLNPTTGDKTGFTAIKAFNTVYAIATFSEAGNTYKDTVQVQTVPGPATRLVIESGPDSTGLNVGLRAGSVTIGTTAQKDSVYAVLLDANNNFVGFASGAQWTSRNTGVVSVAAARTYLGEEEITRQTLTSSNTFVVAQQGAMKDSVQVIVTPVGFSKIKIVVVVSANPDTGFKTLSMRTDQDTTLYALGLRNDGSNQWVPVTVSWGPGAGMTFVTNPKDSTAWNVQPTTPDTGYIKIVFGTLRDSVLAMFTYGNPTAMKLYPASGQPDAAPNMAYKDTVNVIAGQTFPIWAKLFSGSQWLRGYERTDAPFTWKIDELTGAVNSGTLISAGSHSTFTGYKAYQSVKVTATFSENNITLVKTVVISIGPAAAAQLDIEPDSSGRAAYPNVSHRAGQVTMQATDNTLPVYAVLRDPYGNFVSFSDPTTWNSRDTTKAGVTSGAAAAGQGILIRKTPQGQTVVTAADGTHPAFTDSVVVVLSNISYTKLRIVTGDSTVITRLSLSIDQSQEIKVQGFRSDSAGWEYVNGAWSISGGASTATNPPGASINWIVVPADTGSGTIKVTLGTATPDSIPVHFTLGAPKRIVLYPAEGNPLSMTQFPDPGIAVVDSAGKALLVVAKVFDKANNWLSSYETSISPVTWSVVEQPGNTDMPTGAIVPSNGDKTTLTATRAGNSILVVAVFASGTILLSDSVKVTVTPAAPVHLVIESSSDKNLSPHRDNPDTLVQIPSSETYALVYAILRDAYGNFIGPSQHTLWLSLDSAVVTAGNGGLVSLGQGQITRTPGAPRDRAQVTALSLDYAGLRDTTTAVVLQYYYLALRIVNPQFVPIDNLKMNTNQDTTLYVQGQRSTDGVWENTSAQWQTGGGLSIVPSAPGNASAWTFSPDKPGTGTIRVTSLNGDTMTTKPYTIAATFTVGPPTNVQIRILTPPDSLIAGDTIVSVVSISNKDGLVPDTFCTTSAYNNALGGLAGHDPVVITGDTTGKMTQSLPECFHNGVDTVRFVLYRAPAATDSLEKITVALNGLNATTAPFLMHPGDLARIAIEDFAGNNLDSVKLAYPTGSQLFLSVGYDAFGNKRGLENSTWSTDGTLHPVTDASNVSRVFYQSSQSIYNEAGYLIATAKGKNGALITDSAHVSITGPQTNLVSAVTQDSSGNGYLDYIVIRFDKLVTITKEYPADSIVITAKGDDGKTYTLTVDSIYGRSSSTDSVFIIKLTEPKKGDAAYGQPETDWTPLITMPAISGVSPVNAHPSSDGAGPVVWSVVKTISGGDPANRASDLVTVVFSEPITTNGNNFNTSLAPVVVLHIWTVNSAGDTVERDTILSGINEFYQLQNNNTSLSFYMSNGNDLTSRDYISISVDTGGKALVADKSTPPNVPDLDNQKVQVVVSSQPPKEIKVAPNPSGPTFVHQPAGRMNLAFNPLARDWVRQDQSGVLLTFDVTPHIDLATGKIERVTGVLKILDMIGNVVFSLDSTSSRDGIIPKQWASADTSTFHFDMYWNGSNSKGMRVAPGIYRTVLYLKYEHEARPIKYIGTVGLTR